MHGIRAAPLILINMVLGKEWILCSAASCNRYYIILPNFRQLKGFLPCQIVISFRINSICTYICCDISCTISFTIDLIDANTHKLLAAKCEVSKTFIPETVMGYNLETVPNTSISQTISKKCNKFSGGRNQEFNNALPKFATASNPEPITSTLYSHDVLLLNPSSSQNFISLF